MCRGWRFYRWPADVYGMLSESSDENLDNNWCVLLCGERGKVCVPRIDAAALGGHTESIMIEIREPSPPLHWISPTLALNAEEYIPFRLNRHLFVRGWLAHTWLSIWKQSLLKDRI